jgi:hypothetical protein
VNRAAWASRFFFLVALVPTLVAAGFAAYEFHIQPPAPVQGSFRYDPTTPLLSKKLVTNGLLLGSIAPSVTSFDKAIGASESLTVRAVRWGSPNPLPKVPINSAARYGAKTLLEVRPGVAALPPGSCTPQYITMRRITRGEGDGWLRSLAIAIISLREPIILSFAPEMNGTWWTFGSQCVSGAEYKSAYRHIYTTLVYDINRRLKFLKLPGHAADLVTFMWQPSAMHRSTPDPKPYWPGSKYVDVVGLDGYYNYQTDTFDTIFGRTLTLIHSLTTKPIMIGETAAGTLYGHRHQIWAIKNLIAGVQRDKLLGFIWFDKNQLGKPGALISHQDWRLENSPTALAVFKREVQSLSIASFAATRAG